MSEFERAWIESERHRHQRLLWALKQECQEVLAPLSLEPVSPLVTVEVPPLLPQTPSRPKRESAAQPRKHGVVRADRSSTADTAYRGKTIVR
ncbi:MAG TPA: hypothetical protein V6D18_15655 [Thermosynechococcaceae cyanobacterium]